MFIIEQQLENHHLILQNIQKCSKDSLNVNNMIQLFKEHDINQTIWYNSNNMISFKQYVIIQTIGYNSNNMI